MSRPIVRIASTRICEDCQNLVTTENYCPLCNEATAPHPESMITNGYCADCAKGPFPAAKLHVITWHEDPYIQTHDPELICRCLKCHKEGGDAK